MEISFPDKLNLIRQQLQTAKTLSGQAKDSLKRVESGSEHASSLLGAVSKDVFEAGLSNQRWALKGAGQRAEESLGQVKVHHDQVATDFDQVLDADPAIGEALYNAKSAAETLGLSSSDTWLLRNAIDSGQREAGYASQSTDEIDKSLWGIEGQLDGVVDSAHELGTPPRWGNGNGRGNGHWGRGRRRHHGDSCGPGGGAGASRFRERLQARILERRNRARELDETTSKLDNPFDDIDRAADRGARHLVDVGSYVDQAMHWVDDLEMKFSKSNQPRVKPKVVAKPPIVVAKPATQPPPLSPIPVFDTPAPEPQPKPEGFFKKPWRSGS